MRIWIIIAVVCLGGLFTACEDQESLQQYFVNNQSSTGFIALDIPASMFAKVEHLNEEQRNTLNTIKKVNFLAIPANENNQELMEAEKTKLSDILKNEKYQLLIKYGGNGNRMELYYTGSEEAVDEMIVYGYGETKGMGIARLLGNKMKPGEILSLIKSLETGDLELEGLKGITGIFLDKAPEGEIKIPVESE